MEIISTPLPMSFQKKNWCWPKRRLSGPFWQTGRQYLQSQMLCSMGGVKEGSINTWITLIRHGNNKETYFDENHYKESRIAIDGKSMDSHVSQSVITRSAYPKIYLRQDWMDAWGWICLKLPKNWREEGLLVNDDPQRKRKKDEIGNAWRHYLEYDGWIRIYGYVFPDCGNRISGSTLELMENRWNFLRQMMLTVEGLVLY